MDFDLMITSLPKLLSAAVITLKLLSASLIIGLFIGFLFAVLRPEDDYQEQEVVYLDGATDVFPMFVLQNMQTLVGVQQEANFGGFIYLQLYVVLQVLFGMLPWVILVEMV